MKTNKRGEAKMKGKYVIYKDRKNAYVLGYWCCLFFIEKIGDLIIWGEIKNDRKSDKEE